MSWTSPFSLPGKWFKGNLHTHTTASDGLLSPEEAIAWYRERGYDFVALTDHWVLSEKTSVATDFVTIRGTELDGPGYHLVALGIDSLPARELAESPQAVVKDIVAQGGLAFFAHPYWTGQTSADIAPVQGILGLEVFNSVCEQMIGRGYARVHWDDLLAQGRRLYGFAVDDVHWKHGAAGKGFVMVRAEELTEEALLQALRKGHFYASTGPAILDLRLIHQDDGQLALFVHCSPCQEIVFFASGPLGRRFVAEERLLTSASFHLLPEQVYLRVECRDPFGGVAWSNPVFVQDVLKA